MEVLNQIFDILTKASSELPKIEVGTFFILSLCAVVLLGIIVGLTYLSSSAAKFRRACQKVVKYLSSVDEINDDNAENFTSACFGKSAPETLRGAWLQYLGVRFGYPSEIISESAVFDKEVKRTRNVRANVFIGIALVVVAVLAFWSLGSNPTVETGAIVGLGLLVSGVIYLVFTVVGKKQFDKARDLFYEMEDDLDAKVDFHVEKDYAMDSSPLLEITAILDEIIAKNTAKVVDFEDVKREVEEKEKSESETVEDEYIEEAPLEEVTAETPVENEESTPIEELIDETPEAQVEEVAESDEIESETEESAESEVVERAESEETPAEETEEPETKEDSDEVAESENVESETETEVDDEIENDVVENEEIIEQEEKAEEVPVEENDDVWGDEDKPQSEEEAIARISEMLSGKTSTRKNANTSRVMKQKGVGDWLSGQNEFAMASKVEAFEEVNIEDEKVMFGRKKKEALKAQQAAEQAQKEQQVFLDSEIIEEPVEEVALEEVNEAPVAAAQAPAQETYDLPEFKRTVITNAPVTALDPEIVEEYEDLDEGDEDIKAPRLSKLPHLVDYVLSLNVSKSTKIKVAQLMFQAYAVFKNSPENKAIVIQCISKIMTSLAADMKK